ncbi:PIN domain-containing protein [Roseofilum casamattae]|uniref:PIN domain-containing protein n=1 Tax=Roseofilum casamattae BLCC-M143 TaxID=3022442 RepID=A0ABT7BZT9_9CYAN|nr:PIN domain-containing protein [Roseofilum casamattae]MDJ1184721.1 PIN domain-containing protein [Roseofilum casamattae BLCC-M143]
MIEVMVDADLILEFFINRECFVGDAEELWKLFQSRTIKGYISKPGLEKINYFLIILGGKEMANKIIVEIQKCIEVCLVDFAVMQEARSLDIEDFESAVEVSCAKENNIYAILTQTPEIFRKADLSVLKVVDLLDRYKLWNLALPTSNKIFSTNVFYDEKDIDQDVSINSCHQLTKQIVTINHLSNALAALPILILNIPWTLPLLLALFFVRNLLGFTSRIEFIIDKNEEKRHFALWRYFLLISGVLIQSISTGVATEGILNQQTLSYLKAEELIQEQVLIIKRMSFMVDIQPVSGMVDIHPKHTTLKSEWEEKAIIHNTVVNDLEFSITGFTILQDASFIQYNKLNSGKILESKWESMLLIRNTVGNDLEFIKQEFPLSYKLHFTKEGTLKYPMELIRLATLSYITKLSQLDFVGLAYPLFFSLLLLTVNTCTCTIAILYTTEK